MLRTAFKEMAVICAALADGRQALILRKGGVAEAGGEFRPDHARFLLYPTFFHEQHQPGVVPDLLPLLHAAEAARPPIGTIRFTHFCEVAAVRRVEALDTALALAPLHGWTADTVRQKFHYRTARRYSSNGGGIGADTVRQKFHYRTPGLYVLAVRVFALPRPADVPERPEYAGCKTWVELDAPLDTDGATPVLSDAAFAAYLADLNARLGA